MTKKLRIDGRRRRRIRNAETETGRKQVPRIQTRMIGESNSKRVDSVGRTVERNVLTAKLNFGRGKTGFRDAETRATIWRKRKSACV